MLFKNINMYESIFIVDMSRTFIVQYANEKENLEFPFSELNTAEREELRIYIEQLKNND